MSALSELLSQVPGLAWLLLAAILFAALWKVFDVLYVKPRDFRISSLERENEALKSARDVTEPPRLHAELPVAPAEPATPETTTTNPKPGLAEQSTNSANALAEGLRTLEFALERIHDGSFTDLQLESVREYFVGKTVVWKAIIRSVSASNGNIVLHLVPNADSYHSAAAEFDEADKTELLKFRKGDHVVVSGQVDKIFIGTPWLKHCSITSVS